MSGIPYGPTYEEMLYPEKIESAVREKALAAFEENEFDPINLFNITWKDAAGRVRKIVLPPELTGVEANIVVLLGSFFPSGSHKVGAAYATLIEGYIDGEFLPGQHTILGPSSGNFGIGVAYICHLMGYQSMVIMPEGTTRERVERIKKYGAELELVQSKEAGMVGSLRRTRELMENPHNKALAQFELLPNYRFHRYVTGHSAVEAVQEIGSGRIACFAVAPGSGGTVAAGDHIKTVFPDAKIAALEPYECATLALGANGPHRIEGIGDNLCNLIHNVATTDYVVLVHDEDCVKGLKLVQDGTEVLVQNGVDQETAAKMRGQFGVSGICNILGAIKMAKYLDLGRGENVVTVATDSFDRYNSVLEDLDKRCPTIDADLMNRWQKEIFLGIIPDGIYDVQGTGEKKRLFQLKEEHWMPFGYTKAYLDQMKGMNFWDREYVKIKDYDTKIRALRKK